MMRKLLWCLLFSLLLDITAGTEKGCTDDVELIYTIGQTSYENIPISILHQDTWTVTFEIKHEWDGLNSLDLFVHYVDPMHGLLACLYTEQFEKGEPLKLTAGCMTPAANIAVVYIVAMHNDLGEGDIATPPKCCDYNGPENVPAVQYAFTVQCIPKFCPAPEEEPSIGGEYGEGAGDNNRSIEDIAAEAAREQEHMKEAEKEQIKELAKDSQKL